MDNTEYYSHPYYICNFLLGLIYPLIKYIGFNSTSLSSKNSWGLSSEYSVISCVVIVIILINLNYSMNTGNFIDKAIFYLKLEVKHYGF